MTIEIEDRHGRKIVRPQGEFTADAGAEFVEQVTDLFVGPGVCVVLDLGLVSFVNSTALGHLVRVAAQGNTQECRVVLANLSPFVAGVLNTTRLDRFFETYGTVEDALAKLV